MGFKYEDEELELELKDQKIKFRAPSALEQKAISKKLKEFDEETEDPVEIYMAFFESLGLSREVTGKMSFKGLMDLFGYSVGVKKN